MKLPRDRSPDKEGAFYASQGRPESTLNPCRRFSSMTGLSEKGLQDKNVKHAQKVLLVYRVPGGGVMAHHRSLDCHEHLWISFGDGRGWPELTCTWGLTCIQVRLTMENLNILHSHGVQCATCVKSALGGRFHRKEVCSEERHQDPHWRCSL